MVSWQIWTAVDSYDTVDIDEFRINDGALELLRGDTLVAIYAKDHWLKIWAEEVYDD